MIRTRKELVELAGSCSFILGLSNSCIESGIFSSKVNLRLSNLRLSLYTIVDIVIWIGKARGQEVGSCQNKEKAASDNSERITQIDPSPLISLWCVYAFTFFVLSFVMMARKFKISGKHSIMRSNIVLSLIQGLLCPVSDLPDPEISCNRNCLTSLRASISVYLSRRSSLKSITISNIAGPHL